MNNPKIVKAYVEESPQAIELLGRIGFNPWLRQDNRPLLCTLFLVQFI